MGLLTFRMLNIAGILGVQCEEGNGALLPWKNRNDYLKLFSPIIICISIFKNSERWITEQRNLIQ